jgi:hypothetical protein
MSYSSNHYGSADEAALPVSAPVSMTLTDVSQPKKDLKAMILNSDTFIALKKNVIALIMGTLLITIVYALITSQGNLTGSGVSISSTFASGMAFLAISISVVMGVFFGVKSCEILRK